MIAAGDTFLAAGTSSSDLLDYLRSVSRPEPAELAALRQRTAALPFVAMMQGSPAVGQLLQFLIRLVDARKVIEVGTFTGCTTLAMASAIPDGGTVVALDVSERWAAVGRESWARSGVADRIDLRIGDANDTLDTMIERGAAGSFDLAFVDANKDAYEGYYERCLRLLRQNGLLVFDNVMFGGRVLPGRTDAHIRDEEPKRPKSLQDLYVSYTTGLRRFNERISRDERVDVVVLPMSDGVTVARKR